MKNSLPSVSVIIPTYNSAATLEKLLSSIRNQTYPASLIEIIIADGGSTDRTIDIATKYSARIVMVTERTKQGAEYNRACGAHSANHELLLFLDHDNVIPHQEWLGKMTQPLIDDSKIIAVETLRYAYVKKDPILSRYFSLFAVNDILAFYLGKADRLPYLYDTPSQYGSFRYAAVTKRSGYYIVNFDPKHIPTLGSNGFLIRKTVLFNYADVRKDFFFHIDVNVDLIRKGYQRYAFINDVLIHDTHERGVFDYLRRRLLFMMKYGMYDISRRRYSVYEKNDTLNLILFLIYGLTFVKPIADSFRGFMRIRDGAWFLNPFMCFAIVLLYGAAVIVHGLQKYGQRFLGR